MKKVSIVILNWNGKNLLEKFLPPLIKYTDANIADIIVADNASTDDSILFLKNNYPNLSTIELSDNFGFAEGYNKALSEIKTEYFVLLNSDVEVSENWLTPMINFLDKHKNVVAVQPKVLSERNKENFEYAGASGGFIDRYGYPFCRGRIFDNVETDISQYDTPIQIFWATGACMVIRSEEYKNAGGLDSTFFAHMEEIDLCWRLNARGHKLYCIPQSTVYHVGGATLDEESPRKTFLNFRNNMLMLYKNMNSKEFKKVYFIRSILDYMAALQLALTGKTENGKAILEARKVFKKIKVEYEQARIENLKHQAVKNIETIYPKSILWSFYLKGKKTFNNLKWQ